MEQSTEIPDIESSETRPREEDRSSGLRLLAVLVVLTGVLLAVAAAYLLIPESDPLPSPEAPPELVAAAEELGERAVVLAAAQGRLPDAGHLAEATEVLEDGTYVAGVGGYPATYNISDGDDQVCLTLPSGYGTLLQVDPGWCP